MSDSADRIATRFLTDAVIIFFASAAGYYYAFLVQKAYLQHFYIPEQFATVSVGTIAFAVSGVLGFVLLVMYTLDVFATFGVGSSEKFWVILRHTSFFIFFGTIALVTLIATGLSVWTAVWGGVALWFAFLTFILPWQDKKPGESYYESIVRDDQSEEVYSQRSIFAYLGNRFGTALLGTLWLAAFVVPPLCSLLGYQMASTQRDFLTFYRDGDWLLIQVTNDQFVFVGYDATSNSLQKRLKVLATSDLTEGEMIPLHIKPPTKSE